MPLTDRLLLVATAVCCFSTLFAFPVECTIDHNCRCLTTTTSYISPRHIRRIQIFPPAAHCHNIKFLITLKNNNTVCVDHEAKHFNRIIKAVQNRTVYRTKSPVPT
ncbi:alveolar macrophage chemotactic factor-like [Salminus brasiliensis]|uniref:alveolar macrophage chemotactic factor-like n=1 Tax=Salminus brasiliensis TaxID=930266 RepID=UPI003B833C27